MVFPTHGYRGVTLLVACLATPYLGGTLFRRLLILATPCLGDALPWRRYVKAMPLFGDALSWRRLA